MDLFFVLSGFLITGILVRSRGARGYFRNFYARRALRIWPLYYLTVAFAFVVAPHIPLLGTDAMQGQALIWVLFLQNITMAVQLPHATAFDNLWSVAIEAQFYLLLPILVLRFSPKQLPVVLLGAGLVGLATRTALYAASVAPAAMYFSMPTRMDAFAIGGLLSIGLASPTWRPRLAQAAPAIAWLTMVVLLIIAVLQYGFDPYQPLMGTGGLHHRRAVVRLDSCPGSHI